MRTKSPTDPQAVPVVDKIAEYRQRADDLTATYSLPEFAFSKGAAEFKVKYAGAFPGQTQFEAHTNRNELLLLLDEGRRAGFLVHDINSIGASSDPQDEAVITISVYGIKVSSSMHGILLRRPLHTIAAMNLIEEDGIFYFCVWTGEPEYPTLELLVFELNIFSVSTLPAAA